MIPSGFEPLSTAELRSLLAAAVARGQDEFASRIADRILNKLAEHRQFVAAAQFLERKRG